MAIHCKEDFFDALTEETMVDMAERFFGRRKSLDEERELFDLMARTLKVQADDIVHKASLLHALLLDGDAVADFYAALDTDPGPLADLADPAEGALCFKPPRALTSHGRFAKLLLAAYVRTADACDAYVNGHLYEDPREPGKKRLSMHYRLLKDWCGDINRRIQGVNEGMAPSCVLGFARGLDVEGVRKADILDSGMGNYACSLDADLHMPSVDCGTYGLPEFVELPLPNTVKKTVLRFGRRLHAEHVKRLQAIVERVGGAHAADGEDACAGPDTGGEAASKGQP